MAAKQTARNLTGNSALSHLSNEHKGRSRGQGK